MKTVIINGQNHKGSTYHIGKLLADKIGGEVTEFFLPRDFSVAADKCPHFEKQQPILKAMDEADLIILTSPVYVYHVTAPMKNFLDHQGHRWMVHRPRPEMFHKQAVCISTAAGAGMKSTNKDMQDSLFFWGVPKVYKIGIAVRSVNWDTVSPKIRQKIDQAVDKTAAKILKNNGKVKPGIKTKGFFSVMRMLQSKGGLSKPDAEYWKVMGWTGNKRPWK